MARSLLAAHAMLEAGALETLRTERYAGWKQPLGSRILAGGESLSSLREHVRSSVEPPRVSGRQEMLERIVARFIERGSVEPSQDAFRRDGAA